MKKEIEVREVDKLIIALLCEVHKELKIKKELDPEFISSRIIDGNYWALSWKYPGLFGSEPASTSVVDEVGEILSMWRAIMDSLAKLSPDQKSAVASEADPFGAPSEFPGFDGNNESEHLGVAIIMVDELERFTELKGRSLNSHAPNLSGYRNMLRIFAKFGAYATNLTKSQIVEVLSARKYW